MKTGRGMSLRLPLRITCEEFNKELFDKGGRQEEEKEEKEKEAKKLEIMGAVREGSVQRRTIESKNRLIYSERVKDDVTARAISVSS